MIRYMAIAVMGALIVVEGITLHYQQKRLKAQEAGVKKVGEGLVDIIQKLEAEQAKRGSRDASQPESLSESGTSLSEDS